MKYITGRRRVFSGKVTRVDEIDLDFHGHQATFEVVTFDVETGVSALPVMGDKVILIKHYQVGIDTAGYSLPTGGLHAGEDPAVRMNQELMEEIGMYAEKLTLLTRFHSIPSYIGTKAGYLYLATDLVKRQAKGDEDYPITIVPLPMERAIEMVKAGEILDNRTMTALLWYKQFGRKSDQ